MCRRQSQDHSCESAAVGAIIGEMVGNWLVTGELRQRFESGEIKPGSDDYNKVLNTTRLTTGAIALLYDFDVDTAPNEALVAVENNGLKAVVQTVKIAGKLVKVAVKNSKVTIKDLKDVLRKEGFDIVDDLITLTDGQLTFGDAKAIIDLVVGTNLNNR
ncbi:hypothetical protein [Moraxella catarrhalis]|uniref:hypothetical protein n=2 Tax=Moraxella catarrhalis TaxID=480 RepID=UPI001D0DA2A1|nr:hypothetical protein [Moraxella catarrhalis]